MAIILSLEKLFDDVGARFVSEATAVTQDFGWRRPAQQLTQPSHINWIPGDDESGDFGKMQGPKFPGRNPRPLWTPRELFTCYLQGYDASAASDERAQWRAARLVYDHWARAIYLASYGMIEIDSARWKIDKKEARFGATLRVVGAILGMTPDTELPVAPADTHAHITLTQQAVVEVFDVNPAP